MSVLVYMGLGTSGRWWACICTNIWEHCTISSSIAITRDAVCAFCNHRIQDDIGLLRWNCTRRVVLPTGVAFRVGFFCCIRVLQLHAFVTVHYAHFPALLHFFPVSTSFRKLSQFSCNCIWLVHLAFLLVACAVNVQLCDCTQLLQNNNAQC